MPQIGGRLRVASLADAMAVGLRADARRFTHTFLAVFLGATFLAALVNTVVDPHALVGFPRIDHLNAGKTAAHVGGGRRFKSAMLARGTYDTIILGTSRVEVGLDPDSTVLRGRRTFNAGLSGTNMHEIGIVYQFIVEHQRPATLVMGLDLLTFGATRTTSGDFEKSLFAVDRPLYLFKRLFNLFDYTTLTHSWNTVRDNIAGKPSIFTDAGASRNFLLRGPIDHRRLFSDTLRGEVFTNFETYAGFEYSADRLGRFEGLIRDAAGRGIQVRLFISPVHAWQLEAVDALDLFPVFEHWKLDLVRIINRINLTLDRKERVRLWDFSGYNSVTTEPVPANGKAPMRGYWEASHYKHEVGDMVLARILEKTDDRALPADFGIELTPDSIDSVLKTIRHEQATFRGMWPADASEVRRIAAETHAVRERVRTGAGATRRTP